MELKVTEKISNSVEKLFDIDMIIGIDRLSNLKNEVFDNDDSAEESFYAHCGEEAIFKFLMEKKTDLFTRFNKNPQRLHTVECMISTMHRTGEVFVIPDDPEQKCRPRIKTEQFQVFIKRSERRDTLLGKVYDWTFRITDWPQKDSEQLNLLKIKS